VAVAPDNNKKATNFGLAINAGKQLFNFWTQNMWKKRSSFTWSSTVKNIFNTI